MARVELSESWDLDGEVKAVRRDVLAFCERRKMRLVEERKQRLVLEQGSQFLTRFLGGWFVPAEWLPKQATIQLSEMGPGQMRVRVLLEEALGFGILDPMLARKYETFFQQWLDDFEDGLR